MKSLQQIIPEQKTGTKTGTFVIKKSGSSSLARSLFKEASERLLDINNWGRFAGKWGARFWLTDHNGILLYNQGPEPGLLIRIKLPAPSNTEGDGYDWVQIEKIEANHNDTEEIQFLAIRVRPVPDPVHKSGPAAHFYTKEATSTFAVVRDGRTVAALELGRNEKANTSGKHSVMNKLRNFIIAVGARLGLARSQWKALMSGILTTPASGGNQ